MSLIFCLVSSSRSTIKTDEKLAQSVLVSKETLVILTETKAGLAGMMGVEVTG